MLSGGTINSVKKLPPARIGGEPFQCILRMRSQGEERSLRPLLAAATNAGKIALMRFNRGATRIERPDSQQGISVNVFDRSRSQLSLPIHSKCRLHSRNRHKRRTCFQALDGESHVRIADYQASPR